MPLRGRLDRVRSLVRGAPATDAASTETRAAPAAPPQPPAPADELPYSALLHAAEAEGRILHRDDIYGSGPPVDAASPEILAYVHENAGHRVLDVGCGIGPYVAHLIELGHDCIGVDTNEQAVTAGRSLGRPLQVGSAYDLAFEDDSFDTVILVECLEHVEDVERALAEAARVARKSLVLTVPNIGVIPWMSKWEVVPWHMLEGTHINFFTPETLRKILLRHTRSCDVTTLGQFLEIEGVPMHMHAAAVAHL